MSNKPNVLVICTSIRATGNKEGEIKKAVETSNSYQEVLSFFSDKKLEPKGLSGYSNSEIMAAVAMFGSKESGANVDYFSLRKLFKVDNTLRLDKVDTVGLDEQMFYMDTTRIKKNILNELVEKVKEADSIILATPVYFGDRSSLADYFLKMMHERGLIKGKAFSVISVGAKRNGGQETANVYTLFDAVSMGAYGIGNGPKTSQYGGTCVGGDRGSVINDSYGMETVVGTGRRSAQVARILNTAENIDKDKLKSVKIGVLIFTDNPNRDIQKRTEDVLSRLDGSLATFEIVNLVDYRVERCLACNVCPFPPMVKVGSRGKTDIGKTDYACIIDNGKDYLEVVRERLKGMMGLIIVSANDDNINGLVDQYQSFTERTRFIRRNNFEWMNTPFTALIFKDIGSSRDRLFGLRSTTSYLRHNTIATSPNRILTLDGDEISFPGERLDDFIVNTAKLAMARNLVGPVEISYVAGGTGGYADTRLDHTKATRK